MVILNPSSLQLMLFVHQLKSIHTATSRQADVEYLALECHPLQHYPSLIHSPIAHTLISTIPIRCAITRNRLYNI